MIVVFFQDDYPLMAPYDIENNRVVVPPLEPFPTLPVAAVSVAVVAVVAVAGLLVYQKKTQKRFSQETLNNKKDCYGT